MSSHQPLMVTGMNFINRSIATERILTNVAPEPNSGCWLWLGALDRGGYGLARAREYPGERRAHRLSYLVFKGSIGSLYVCHTCDVRSCVNPDHLWLGTHQDNMADRAAKGGHQRPVLGPPLRRNPHAKLSDDQVRFLRLGNYRNRQLAALWGISPAAITRAARRETYRLVPDDAA